MIARFALLIVAMTLWCAPVHATDESHDLVLTPLQSLVGEARTYGIDFLFFSRLAEGELRFSATETPDIYRAELVGRTLGIASWLTGDRTQTYTSLMRLMADGTLRSIEYTSHISKKRWGKWTNRGKVRRFDYRAGTVYEEKLKEGEVTSQAEHKIPVESKPVDMLTAFYNVRSGAYGPLKRGERIFVPTFSGKGFAEIDVYVLTLEEQQANSRFPAHGVLVRAIIDPEIFETDSGNLYVWFDPQGVPERGIIEDMIGLGDVYGSLDKEEL